MEEEDREEETPMARSGGAGRRTAREDRGHAEHGGVDIITDEERRL